MLRMTHHNIIGKRVALMMLATIGIGTVLAQGMPSKANEHFFYKDYNYIDNIYQGLSTPVGLAYNRVGTVTDASVFGHFERGAFHQADAGSKISSLNASLYGLQRFKKLSIEGQIGYVNSKEYDRRWNSTLFLTHTNPFVIGDSIASDVSTELFNMSVGAAYEFSPLFVGAIKLAYKAGSSADQTDPRPKVNSSRFAINPGVEFRLGSAHRLGLSATWALYSSELTHTIINGYTNYAYFLMKGSGDYIIRTNGDLAGYPRDYSGNTLKGAAQWVFAPASSALSNILEVELSSINEDAEDGGAAYTFKAGDYDKRGVSIADRLRLVSNNRFIHNITASFGYYKGKGYWYDQRKKTDTEHGNIAYYETLNKSKVHDASYYRGDVGYQFDQLKNGLPDLTLKLSAGINGMSIKQYQAKMAEQKFTTATIDMEIGKYWMLGSCRMQGLLEGYTSFAICDKQADFIQESTREAYAAPTFEYLSAKSSGFKAHVSANFPVQLYGTNTWFGLFANVACQFYNGDTTYSKMFDSKSRTTINAGVSLKF
uniref:DUF6850 domain-containing protein n=1 Tax=Prevotella sp. GTC17259 TaxID=3236795 RepID=A0AB33J982_9BACT